MQYRTSARAQMTNNPQMKVLIRALGVGAFIFLVFSLLNYRSNLSFERSASSVKRLDDGQMAIDDY